MDVEMERTRIDQLADSDKLPGGEPPPDQGAVERSTQRLALTLALVLLLGFAILSLLDPIGHVLADTIFSSGPYGGCGGG